MRVAMCKNYINLIKYEGKSTCFKVYPDITTFSAISVTATSLYQEFRYNETPL